MKNRILRILTALIVLLAAICPAAAADPDPQPTAAPGHFSDTAGHWAELDIEAAAEMGLFSGYPDGSFHPDEKTGRAQFVTVLWRMKGRPEPAADSPFQDIADQPAEFQKAVRWAYEQGIISGISETAFGPSEELSREAAVTILFRCAGGFSGMELFFADTYDAAYEDSGEISDWAKPAMYWAVYQTIIRGTSETALSPKQSVTRAQLAVILLNYLEEGF